MTTSEIWSQFNNELRGFIKTRVSKNEYTEDILQDVFVKIHQKINQLEDSSKLVSWVYQITRNTIIDYYRKKKIPLSDDPLFENIDDDEHTTINPQFINCLRPFIKQLPKKYKDALEQTVFGDLSQKEYAKQLGISYSTLKSRVQRGKQKLKDLFVGCCSIQTDRYGNIISSNIDNCNC